MVEINSDINHWFRPRKLLYPEMKNYKNYKVEDFASDNEFIEWCLLPSEENNLFWNNWVKTHPRQKYVILQAKQLVLDLQSIERDEHETNFEKEIWNKIEDNITAEDELKPRLKYRWLTGIAATVSLLIIAFLAFNNIAQKNQTEQLSVVEWINYENNSANSKMIFLPDQSTVELEPFSTLKYPSVFADDQRAVFLKGEAFFDVTRDTLKPFMVYANETITKVLGTSFRIYAFEGQETVEVEVKTGKVAVYAQVESDDERIKGKQMTVIADKKIVLPLPNKKLEVTPNQKVVFDREQENMIKTIAKLPMITSKIEDLPRFEFKEASVVEVFKAIEHAYKIELKYDEVKLKNCTINTKLTNESLFEKLNIICLALNLEFNEEDAIIYISGEGC